MGHPGITRRAASLAALLLLPFHLHAQRVEPDTTRPLPLDTLTVNVLRSPFDLTEVPFAVGVNTESQIQRARPGLGLDEALRGIPGVQVDNRFNYALGERISIRGFGARAQFGVRGIKVLVDGIPATLPDGQTTLNHVDLGFLRRAEVIRGPASALYGNAAGGVIQLQSEEPPPVPIGQEFGVIAGGDGLLRIHSTTGGQSGRVSYLLNAARLAYDGYREFSAAENLHLNARLGYRTERDELRLLVNAVDYDAENPGSLSDSLLRVDRSRAFANNVRQRTGEEGRQGQLGATWRRTLNEGELELSGYALMRRIDNPIPPVIIDLERAAGGVRALFRSVIPLGGREMGWTVGAETDLQRDDRRNFANRGGERDTLSLDQRERVTNLGAFAQLATELAPRLNLLGGVRYDYFRFRADDRFVREDNPDDSGDRTLDAVSPSLGVTYEAADALHLYANVATSFETPTTTELANRASGVGGFNPDLEPQEAVSYEAGAKGRLPGMVTYQVAAYRAEVDNQLIPFEVPDVPGRQFFRNAGSAVHQGVEAGLAVAPLRELLLRATYTYTDARFDVYRTENASFDGNRVPGIAPHRAELILSYMMPSGWFADAEGRYTSRIQANDANTASSPSYTLVDLRAGLEEVRIGRTLVSPFAGITNLFDETYNTSVAINAFGRRFFEPGPGRTFYAGLNLGIGWR